MIKRFRAPNIRSGNIPRETTTPCRCKTGVLLQMYYGIVRQGGVGVRPVGRGHWVMPEGLTVARKASLPQRATSSFGAESTKPGALSPPYHVPEYHSLSLFLLLLICPPAPPPSCRERQPARVHLLSPFCALAQAHFASLVGSGTPRPFRRSNA